MWIIDVTKGCVVARRGRKAAGLFDRMKGLIGMKKFENGEALWITPCQGIHTVGMRFAIDALYLDETNTVTSVVERMPVNQFGRVDWKAHSVIELPSGTANLLGVSAGDRIVFSDWDEKQDLAAIPEVLQRLVAKT